jgi:hypothetical protein
VQRSFSDAHRALVAALEWEEEGLETHHPTMTTTTTTVAVAMDSEMNPNRTWDHIFPLLKCLLRSSVDIAYDL